MNPRTRFKTGLLIVDASILILAKQTWCRRDPVEVQQVWHSTNGWWSRFTAEYDLATYFWSIVIVWLATAGVFMCVDALVWGGPSARAGRSVVEEA